jgi:hypothetical protein
LRTKIDLVFAGGIPSSTSVHVPNNVGYYVRIDGASGESSTSNLQLIDDHWGIGQGGTAGHEQDCRKDLNSHYTFLP